MIYDVKKSKRNFFSQINDLIDWHSVSQVINKSNFVKSIKNDSRIKKVIARPDDPAYHIEIPQK